MKLSFAGVFADAGVIWRNERQLLARIAGVFYVVPILGFVMLLGASGVMQTTPPEQMQEALNRFYGSNLLAIFLVTIAMDFGTFAILNLFLQGGGRTLGEVLMLTLRRLLPFLAIDLLGNFAFAVGLSLFVLPGLFALARTWLAAPAYAARPEQGVIEALRQGWIRSGGLVWLVLLGVSGVTMLGTLSAVVAVSAILGLVHTLLSGSQVVVGLSYLAIALIGAFAWTAVTVLRVAAYRLTEPR